MYQTSYPVLYKRENCRHCCLLAKIAKSEKAGLFVQIPEKSIVQYIQIFKTRDSMISDRFVVPEIEIANPPDAI